MPSAKPITMDDKIRDIFQRYHSPLEDTKVCWLWQGGSSDGYGVVGVYRNTLVTDNYKASRISYMIFHNLIELDDPRQIMHSCDNPMCVNPHHLSLGTNKENNQDKVEKDRQAKGENHGQAKLTDDLVYEIKKAFATTGETIATLARRFDTHYYIIYGIVHGFLWKHVHYNYHDGKVD